MAGQDSTTPPGLTQPISALNAEAGDFEVTTDPAALAASELANARTLARFPYLVARFGERGRAFSRSDGAWLVSLAPRPRPGCSGRCAGSARCSPLAGCRG
jgi:hypothetical protein